jgi:AcrR family transcriptional regulator
MALNHGQAGPATSLEAAGAPGARRLRRRQETIDEILQHAVAVMQADGVAALSLSEVARRMGIKPPSLYKYFPSKLAVYDELFRRGSEAILAVFQEAAEHAGPGLPALLAGLQATGRFMIDNQVLTALLQWRPVPGFEPTPEAFEPNVRFVAELHRVLADAVALGQLHPDALSERAGLLFSILGAGIISQQLANEPQAGYDEGRFTSLGADVFDMFVRTFHPDKESTQ